MILPKRYIVVLSSVMLSAGLASAQTNHANHTAMSMDASHSASAFHREMTESMAKMHEDMTSAPMTGNPDIDFAEMMIPHHQGAIDMAKIQLKYGKDAALRALAEDIIKAQEKEIADMRQRIQQLKASTPKVTAPAHSNH